MLKDEAKISRKIDAVDLKLPITPLQLSLLFSLSKFLSSMELRRLSRNHHQLTPLRNVFISQKFFLIV